MLLGGGEGVWAKWIKSFKLSSLCELGLWRKIDVLLFDVMTKVEYKAISLAEYLSQDYIIAGYFFLFEL